MNKKITIKAYAIIAVMLEKFNKTTETLSTYILFDLALIWEINTNQPSLHDSY